MASISPGPNPRQILDDVIWDTIGEGLLVLQLPDNIIREPEHSREAFYEELVLASEPFFSDPDTDQMLLSNYIEKVQELALFGIGNAMKAFEFGPNKLDEYEVAREVGASIVANEGVQGIGSLARWKDVMSSEEPRKPRDVSHMPRIRSGLKNGYYKQFDRTRTPLHPAAPRLTTAEEVMTYTINDTITNQIAYIDRLFTTEP